MTIEATNNFVYIIRDETQKEIAGLIIPGKGQEKPNMGTVYSVGDLVRDKKIKGAKNKKAMFFRGTGFEIEHEKQTYLVLTDDQIIGIEKN